MRDCLPKKEKPLHEMLIVVNGSIHSVCFSDAIASSENVRIAPSLRSQKGAIWTKQKTNFDWWEVEIVFRVSGRGRIGADGLVCAAADTHPIENGCEWIKLISFILFTWFLGLLVHR